MTERRKYTRRTGGRSARVLTQIYEAALETLVQEGLGGLTVPAIARRAYVHPTTIYRRWNGPDALVLDAIRSRSDINVAIPDTESLAGDLEQFLINLDGYVRSPLGRALLRIQIFESDEARGIGKAFWADRFVKASVMVERAVARGEIPADADARRILEFAIAPIYLHAFALHGDFTDTRLKDHVRDTIFVARSQQELERTSLP